MKELEGDKYGYLYALTRFYEKGNQPILAINEVRITNKEGEKEVIKNKKGEFSYSLETMLSDVNALSSEVDSATSIIKICRKYDKDPNGRINDLTPEIIMEINDVLFEVSDHPKD